MITTDMNERELHLNPDSTGWLQNTFSGPTDAELAVIQSPGFGSSEGDAALIETITARRWIRPTTQDEDNANAIYESRIPSGAALINAVITLPDGRGIINYRSGNDHQQIRF